jgi:hypothetical protein
MGASSWGLLTLRGNAACGKLAQRVRAGRVDGGRVLTAEEGLTVLGVESGETSVDLRPKFLHESLDRPCSGITESADGVALDLLAEGCQLEFKKKKRK